MKEYFEINIRELQSLALWAAACAERSLSIYEHVEHIDFLPRLAIESIKEFANSGKRTQKLRKAAMDAYRASLETTNAAAAAAAKAASLAAASAYTHPFKDIHQAVHILGPAAYAALAVELSTNGEPEAGNDAIAWAVAHINYEAAALLKKMPERQKGKKRIDQLLYDLDYGIRLKAGFSS